MNKQKWQNTALTIAEQNAKLKADKEALEARVAMLEEFVADAQKDAWRALDADWVPPAVESAMKSLLGTAAIITQESDPDDVEPNAWLQRQKADELESFGKKLHLWVDSQPEAVRDQGFCKGVRQTAHSAINTAQRLRSDN